MILWILLFGWLNHGIILFAYATEIRKNICWRLVRFHLIVVCKFLFEKNRNAWFKGSSQMGKANKNPGHFVTNYFNFKLCSASWTYVIRLRSWTRVPLEVLRSASIIWLTFSHPLYPPGGGYPNPGPGFCQPPQVHRLMHSFSGNHCWSVCLQLAE